MTMKLPFSLYAGNPLATGGTGGSVAVEQIHGNAGRTDLEGCDVDQWSNGGSSPAYMYTVTLMIR